MHDCRGFGLCLSIYWRALMDHGFLKLLWATALSGVTMLFGRPSPLLVMLLGIMIMDFVLGFAHACRAGTVSGERIKGGMLKIFMYFVGVGVIMIVDNTAGHVIQMVHIPMLDMFVAYLVVHEALSCLNHLSYFGVPIPARVVSYLKDYHVHLGAPAPDKGKA